MTFQRENVVLTCLDVFGRLSVQLDGLLSHSSSGYLVSLIPS